MIAQSTALTGSGGWIRLSKTFYVSVNDAYGIYLDLGLDGVGTVWYDGASVTNNLLDTQVSQTFSQNGDYSVEYYSTDNDDNEELPHKTLDLKVDTVSPTNWRDFETADAGNDHTLTAQITVDDGTSGIDDGAGYFQYSIDGGESWGYYSNLLNCSSEWGVNGWQALNTELENGGLTGELSTPAIDYCNSDWAVCKIVRFKTSDLSGNEATKDVCINGTWFRATGDVGSRQSISLTAAGSSDNTDGVVFSASTIDNFISSEGWYVTNYTLTAKPTYPEFFADFPGSTPLPSGKLPKVSGIYLNNGSFTISSSTIPSGFSSASFSSVVYINGDLTISTDFSILGTSALVFIVAGDVRVDKSVENISAVIIADGQIDASYNGSSKEALVVKGGLMGDYLVINRALKASESEGNPVLDIIYQPVYLTAISPLMGSSIISWKEVNP